ncbi:hypothetical protein J6590_052267 [Homalodisca vitripennis]|nr:hypothetical protein J6590_052267 [Homalodisca vitripennis]
MGKHGPETWDDSSNDLTIKGFADDCKTVYTRIFKIKTDPSRGMTVAYDVTIKGFSVAEPFVDTWRAELPRGPATMCCSKWRKIRQQNGG